MTNFMGMARLISIGGIFAFFICVFGELGELGLTYAIAVDLPASAGVEVTLQTAFPGVSDFTVQSGVTITNSATAASGDSSQVWNFTNRGTLSSTSAIHNRFSGLFLEASSLGTPTVTNFGTISSVSTQPSGSSGVRFFGGGTVLNMAGATISGLDGIHSDRGPVFVSNSGLIQGNSGGTAIYGGAGGSLTNLAGGVISSLNFGYQLNGFERNGLLDNAGQITARGVAVGFSNGETFGILNRPTGVITSQDWRVVSIDATTGYFVNQGVMTGSNTVLGTSATHSNLIINAGVLTAGNNGDAIQSAADDNNSTIYNLGTASGAGTGHAIRLDGSNSLLVLGTQAFLPALNAVITGSGSVLNGGALSTGSNNRLRLTDSGTESAPLEGFVSLNMQGQDWTLGAPLTLSDASSQALAVEAGTLSLLSPFNSPGGISITNAGVLKLSGVSQVLGESGVSGVTLSSGGRFMLDTSAVLKVSGDVTLAGGSAAITNGSVTAGSIALFDASQWEQAGSVTAGSIALSDASQWKQAGNISATSLALTGGSQWTQVAGTALDVVGPISVAGSGLNLSGQATTTKLALASGSVLHQDAGGIVKVSGDVTLTEGSAAITNGSVTAGSIALSDASQWEQAGSVTAGSIALFDASQWEQAGSVTAANIALSGASQWEQAGNLSATSLALTGGSQWTQAAGTALGVTGPISVSGSGLNLAGQATTAKLALASGSVLLQDAGGIVKVSGDVTLAGGSAAITSGSVTAGSIALSDASQWEQAGSVTAGSIALSGSSQWKQAGNLSATSLALTGGSQWTQAAGTALGVVGPISVSGSGLNLAGQATTAKLALASGSVLRQDAGGIVKVSGDVTLTEGSAAITRGSVTAGSIALSGASQWKQAGNLSATSLALTGGSQWTQAAGTALGVTGPISVAGSGLNLSGQATTTKLALASGSVLRQDAGGIVKVSGNVTLAEGSAAITNGSVTAGNIALSGASQWEQAGSVTAGSIALSDASQWKQAGNISATSLALTGGSQWTQAAGTALGVTGPIRVSGSELNLAGDAQATSANIFGGSSMKMTGTGTLDIPVIHVASGSLFRLNSKDARFSLTSATSLNLDSGARYGVTVSRNPAEHSIMFADYFAPVEGVRLDTRVDTPRLASSISSLPGGKYSFKGVVQALHPVVIPTSMQFVSNSMSTIGMIASGNNADLGIAMRSINDVFGPNLEAADVWRITALPGELQRGRLDKIYTTGVLVAGTRHFFELLQGGAVLAVQEAQRENLRSFTGAIRSRLHGSIPRQTNGTSFQEQEARTVVWGDARQYWSRQEDDAGSNLQGYTYNPSRFMLGVERLHGHWRTGLTVQYSEGKMFSADNDAVTRIQSGLFGFYGEYSQGHWYGQFGAQLGSAWNKATTDFATWGDDTRASYNSSVWGGNGEIGYRSSFGDSALSWVITPHIGMDVGSLQQDAFSEKGDPALRRRFASNDYNVVELPVGARVAMTAQIGATALTAYADASYAFNMGDKKLSTTVRFINDSEERWRVVAVDPGRNAFRLEGGVSANIGRNLVLDVSYELEARDRYTSQGMSVSFGVKF